MDRSTINLISLHMVVQMCQVLSFRRVVFLFVGMFYALGVFAQCYDANNAFKAGEVVKYHAYYNWHFIWLNAGEVTFSVNEHRYFGEPSYFIKSYGNTYRAYDSFFKVRDSFEVVVDTLALRPLEFHRKTNEGSTVSHHHYIFKPEDRAVLCSISKSKSPYRDTVIHWSDCSVDILTMVYRARNIDFSKYAPGEKIPIQMIVDGENHDLYIRYLGKERITNREGRRFNCLKFSPLLVSGTIFESGEDMTVWVTDDQNRVPIIVEAKILIGSVKAVFVSAEGLRHPMTAEIISP